MRNTVCGFDTLCFNYAACRSLNKVIIYNLLSCYIVIDVNLHVGIFYKYGHLLFQPHKKAEDHTGIRGKDSFALISCLILKQMHTMKSDQYKHCLISYHVFVDGNWTLWYCI